MELNNSGPLVNLSGSEKEEEVSGWRLEATPLIMALVMASLYGGVAVKVYRKNRHDLEPLHIFELNTLANISGFCLIRAIKQLVILQLTGSVLCSIIQWFTFYSKLNIYAGIVMSQVDRFLALHLHAEYKARVSPELAKGRFREQFDSDHFITCIPT